MGNDKTAKTIDNDKTSKTSKAEITDNTIPPDENPNPGQNEPKQKSKGRGRPPGSRSKKAKVQSLGVIKPVIQQLSDMAKTRKSIWELQPQEIDSLSVCLDAVIDKYIDVGNYSEEFALAIVAGSIFIPRALITIKSNRQPKKEIES